MLGKIFRLLILVFAIGAAFFIYQIGSQRLAEGGFQTGAPEYIVLYLVVLVPCLIALMIILMMIKSPKVKYMIPLILIVVAIIFFMKYKFGI